MRSRGRFILYNYNMASTPKTPIGFEEIEHTADWSLRVWAPDLPAFFEQAAKGMYQLMGAESLSAPIEEIELTVTGEDPETLLVAFLSELLYLLEKGKVAHRFYMIFGEKSLSVQLKCLPLKSISKEIKAVTFHNLAIQSLNGLLEATITFDV